MRFEPVYEKVKSSKRIRFGTSQAVIECKLPAQENIGVKKILCANAKAYMADCFIRDKDVNFSGFVNFQVIYESGENNTESLDYSAEFKDKFSGDMVTEDAVPLVTCSVIDINTNSGRNDVKVTAVIEITVDGIVSMESNVLTGIAGDDVYSESNMQKFNTYDGMIKDKFEETLDVEIKDSVSKILSVCVNPFITTVKPNDKFLTLTGGANINIMYLTEDGIKTVPGDVSVTREVALDTLNINSVVESDFAVCYSDMKVTTNIEGAAAVVNLEIPFRYNGVVFNLKEADAVTDVFAIKHFLSASTVSLETGVNGESVSSSHKLTGSVVIDDGMPFIDAILGTSGSNVVLASAAVNNGALTAEGIATVTVLYQNKETNTVNSILVESPFSVDVNLNEEYNALTPVLNISLIGVNAKSRRGKEIEIAGELLLYADFFGSKTEAVIHELKLADEKPESPCVLSVYIVKQGENLWEVAKNLNLAPDAILEQNPSLLLPLAGNERIIAYRQREVLV